MKPSPAFQLYPQDFLVGCAELTAEQVGGYIRLLCYQWSKGALPDSDKLLAALAGCRVSSIAVLRTKFKKGEDGLLRNARLEEVRLEQDTYRQKQANRAAERWSRGNANAYAPAMPRHSHGTPAGMPSDAMPAQCSSPSPSPSPSKDREGGLRPPLADWLAYAKELNWAESDAAAAFDHYEAVGWKVGSKPVKNWQACARNCQRRAGKNFNANHDKRSNDRSTSHTSSYGEQLRAAGL